MFRFHFPVGAVTGALLLFLWGSCDDIPPFNPPNSTAYTYFWLGATQDAHVTSLMPDFNNDGAFSLVNATSGANGEQRIYLRFFLPQLPQDCQVEEAYINLYEYELQGLEGVASIPIALAINEWDADTITWANQPNSLGVQNPIAYLGEFTVRMKWYGTGNIAGHVQNIYANPTGHFGWMVDNHGMGQHPYMRSFVSMNSMSPAGRTRTSLDFGPRMLMKVDCSTTLNNNNVGTTLSGPTEFGKMYGNGIEFLIYRMATGTDWPDEWDVATN